MYPHKIRSSSTYSLTSWFSSALHVRVYPFSVNILDILVAGCMRQQVQQCQVNIVI